MARPKSNLCALRERSSRTSAQRGAQRIVERRIRRIQRLEAALEGSRPFRRICVLCGSNAGRSSRYIDAARELGTTLASRGIGLVYGGADVGLMGALADAAADADGEVIGVITADLARRVGHPSIHLERVQTMHQRKQRFAELADAYIALPGGLGTLEELFEVATWNQLGIQAKPLGLLNANRYFDGLLAFLGHAVDERFIRREHANAIAIGSDTEELLAELARWQSPNATKRER